MRVCRKINRLDRVICKACWEPLQHTLHTTLSDLSAARRDLYAGGCVECVLGEGFVLEPVY